MAVHDGGSPRARAPLPAATRRSPDRDMFVAQRRLESRGAPEIDEQQGRRAMKSVLATVPRRPVPSDDFRGPCRSRRRRRLEHHLLRRGDRKGRESPRPGRSTVPCTGVVEVARRRTASTATRAPPALPRPGWVAVGRRARRPRSGPPDRGERARQGHDRGSDACCPPRAAFSTVSGRRDGRRTLDDGVGADSGGFSLEAPDDYVAGRQRDLRDVEIDTCARRRTATAFAVRASACAPRTLAP
jgi:hypothetical protein